MKRKRQNAGQSLTSSGIKTRPMKSSLVPPNAASPTLCRYLGRGGEGGGGRRVREAGMDVTGNTYHISYCASLLASTVLQHSGMVLPYSRDRPVYLIQYNLTPQTGKSSLVFSSSEYYCHHL